MAFGIFVFDIKSTMHVFIDALRNISPSELEYDSSIYDARISKCQLNAASLYISTTLWVD